MKHKGALMVLGLLAILIIILILIFDLLELIFTKAGAIIISALLVVRFIRLIAVISTFPGSFYFWKRKVQVDFNQGFCTKLIFATDRLVKFIHTDLDNSLT